jgi:hypothetical protein
MILFIIDIVSIVRLLILFNLLINKLKMLFILKNNSAVIFVRFYQFRKNKIIKIHNKLFCLYRMKKILKFL